jgi:Flp pilus assembly pilin Flp
MEAADAWRRRDYQVGFLLGNRLRAIRKLSIGDNGQFRPRTKHQEDTVMKNLITKMYVKAREASRGQTMTEYALILSAVAVVVFIGYQTMGTDIGALLTKVDNQL